MLQPPQFYYAKGTMPLPWTSKYLSTSLSNPLYHHSPEAYFFIDKAIYLMYYLLITEAAVDVK
jgi:hypothetical protein